MTGTSPKVTSRLREAIELLGGALLDLLSQEPWDSELATSQYQQDLTIADGLDSAAGLGSNEPGVAWSVRYGRGSALAKLEAARDQVALIGAALTGGFAYAPWSLSRAAVESAGAVYWMLDPAADTAERARRVLIDRRTSLRWAQDHWSRRPDSPLIEAQLDHLENRLHATRRLEAHMGITNNARRPRWTELCSGLLQGQADAFYGLASGMTHGELWAISMNHAVAETPETSALYKVQASDRLYLQLTKHTVVGVGEASVRTVRYLGWPHQGLHESLEHALTIGRETEDLLA